MRTNCLSDVISMINLRGPDNSYELLEGASLLRSYFKRPMHEITVSDIKAHRRYIPLYLSSLRIALEDIPAIVDKVDLLLEYVRVSLPEI